MVYLLLVMEMVFGGRLSILNSLRHGYVRMAETRQTAHSQHTQSTHHGRHAHSEQLPPACTGHVIQTDPSSLKQLHMINVMELHQTSSGSFGACKRVEILTDSAIHGPQHEAVMRLPSYSSSQLSILSASVKNFSLCDRLQSADSCVASSNMPAIP